MREAMGSPAAFRGRLLLYMFLDAHTHLEASAGLAANAATTTMVDWLTAMQIAAKPFLASFSFGDLCCSGTSFLGQLDKQDSFLQATPKPRPTLASRRPEAVVLPSNVDRGVLADFLLSDDRPVLKGPLIDTLEFACLGLALFLQKPCRWCDEGIIPSMSRSAEG